MTHPRINQLWAESIDSNNYPADRISTKPAENLAHALIAATGGEQVIRWPRSFRSLSIELGPLSYNGETGRAIGAVALRSTEIHTPYIIEVAITGVYDKTPIGKPTPYDTMLLNVACSRQEEDDPKRVKDVESALAMISESIGYNYRPVEKGFAYDDFSQL